MLALGLLGFIDFLVILPCCDSVFFFSGFWALQVTFINCFIFLIKFTLHLYLCRILLFYVQRDLWVTHSSQQRRTHSSVRSLLLRSSMAAVTKLMWIFNGTRRYNGLRMREVKTHPKELKLVGAHYHLGSTINKGKSICS